MIRGRKSKTARALGCLTAALLAVAVLSPSLASAQTGAEDEYELGTIPGSGDTTQTNSTGGDAQSSGTQGDSSSTATGGAGGPGSGGGGGGGGQGGAGSGQSGSSSSGSPTSAGQTPAVSASSSDDSGAPILLILLAAIAAACTGVAVWRLRRDPGEVEHDPAPAAKPTTSTASESHSA